MDEMKRLIARLNETPHAYYVLDEPVISDDEWDAMYERLKALEAETGIVLPAKVILFIREYAAGVFVYRCNKIR